MSLRAWLALLLFYVIYLLIGAFTFQAIENPKSCQNGRAALQIQLNLKQNVSTLLNEIRDVDSDSSAPEILDQVLAEIESNIERIMAENRWLSWTPAAKNSSKESDFKANKIDCEKWNFYNAFFFSFTAVTTIGYGHLYPETPMGRGICIIYSLFGVPVNGILIGKKAKWRLKQREI